MSRWALSGAFTLRASWRALGIAIGLSLVVGVLAGPAAAAILPPSQAGVNVYDFANIWSQETKDAAQAEADAIKARTGAEIAVVSWPSGESSVSTGGAAYDAHTIIDAWGVGRAGVNDGLVVLFDMDTSNEHGQIFLATGSGFQSMYLSDDEAASIVNDDMLPKAKDGDLDGALTAGLDHLDRVVQPGGNPERAMLAALRLGGAILVSLVALGALAWFLLTWWRQGRDARMPLIDDSVLLPSPPPNLTPALATVLREDRVSRDAFTSALVDLGHRGLVTFRQTGGLAGTSLGSHVDLVVPPRPLDDQASQAARERPLGTSEHGLAQQIDLETDSDGVLDATRLKSGVGRKLYDTFRKHIGTAAQATGWFRDDPNRLSGRWSAIALALGILAVFGFFAFATAPEDEPGLVRAGAEPLALAFALGVVAAFVIGIGTRFLPARTPDGAQTLAMTLAYRNTLRYELQNAPTVTQAVDATQKKLPWITTPDLLTVWAVALGLNTEIDHLIKKTIDSEGTAAGTAGLGGWSPVWYSAAAGGLGGLASTGGLAGMVGSISATATSSSGGGFSGGGGGGGGGAGGGF
ncbi:MAG TPA: TPM domain-containing protein [Candidatus Limnocylindrales bacterium]|nr:TPM domain-containing protein [Candidatus Limnocylindrales bacterium]